MDRLNSAAPSGLAEAAAPPAVLAQYREYLERERGLAPLTVLGYIATAGAFLERTCGADPTAMATLHTAQVTDFVLAESARGLSPRTVNELVVRLRSFLRYLFVKRLVATPLAQAAPWLAGSRVQALPKDLDPGIGPRLLEATPSHTVGGARNHAILSVLIRLGLRTCEVTLSRFG